MTTLHEPHDEFAAVRNDVLIENTAQSVLNYLKTMESNRAHVRTRWIWELLQNARDASTILGANLVVSVEQSEGQVIFRHNGGNFTQQEIAHLIYHGSTKVEDKSAIGQYGSGFLTTHLLSPEIIVSGRLDDGRSFSFPLKRELGSVRQLSESMRNAENSFKASLTDEVPIGSFTTEFSYPLKSEAVDVVSDGITTLKECAPYVVVFNREFASISVESPSETTEYRVVDRSPWAESRFEHVVVAVVDNGNQETRQFLIAHGKQSSVAIPMATDKGSYSCLPVGDVARLFLGFPMIGAEAFSFPAVVNSLQFTPTENRDGVYLWQADNVANQKNQAVLEESCELLVAMLKTVASSGWNNAYRLADIPAMRVQDWLNEDKLRTCLRDLLVERIRHTPAILNERGQAMVPIEAQLPLADTPEGMVELWDILADLHKAQSALPRRDEAAGWSKAMQSWAKLSHLEATNFKETFDGRRLASDVDKLTHDQAASQRTHRVSLLQDELQKDVSAIEWLDGLVGFLLSTGLEQVVRERRIVPSQEGFLRKLTHLHRDAGIDATLKDIAELLGWRIRCELRDTRIGSLIEDPGSEDWDNQYVVGELLKRLRERANRNPDDNFKVASARLFAWLVQHEDWDALRGFPAFSQSVAPSRPPTLSGRTASNRRIEVLYLPTNAQVASRPHVPTGAWPHDLRAFASLFPPNRILADAFFNEMPNAESWKNLVEHALVNEEVVTSASVSYNKFYPDYPLSEEEVHQSVKLVSIRDIWSRVEVMDRVRDSQERARLLWRFLTEWMVPKELQSLEIAETMCECGKSHHYFPAAWIEPLRESNWIRLPDGRRDHANAKSLAHLLNGIEGWDPGSLSEDSTISKLLNAIGVSRLGLMQEFVATDEDSRTLLDNAFISILAASGNDLGQLDYARQYIEDLRDDKDLPQVLAERKERRRQVHTNQRLGKQVEDLVEQSLEGKGFTVQRTDVGSDLAIEFNEVTRLELAKSNRTWLVEVKATRNKEVRMTDTQAKTAVAKGTGFLLCVVPVEGEADDLELDAIRNGMRFVENIGPRVTRLCNDLDGLESLRDDITSGETEGVRLEVISGGARVRVASLVWEQDGFSLNELPDQLE